MFSLRSRFTISKSILGPRLGSCTVLRVCLATLLALCGAAFSHAAQDTPAGAPAVSKMQFPEGTATPSEVCGACHKALYREYSAGEGSDLQWKSMKLQPTLKTILNLPAGVPKSATAHSVAGTEPFPLEARRVEEDGKECNACHFPQTFDYPDMSSVKFEKVTPRTANRERGITCASCHLTPDGKIRGPYVVDAPHETVVDERIQTAVACAYCHSVGARVSGEQTQTFFEWREDFNKPGLGRQHCQDCHMPKTVRKLAEDFDVPERVVARHLWTGGHSSQRIASALNLSIIQPEPGQPQFSFRVTNVGAGHSVPTGSNRRGVYLKAEVINAKGKTVATKEWMFAPWMSARPDDRGFLEEDKKGHDPIATTQADAQGPHETPIRAGEARVLEWGPEIGGGQYTVRATLVYDLNRYNDRAFKDDQQEIARATIPVKIARPVKVSRSGSAAGSANSGGKNALVEARAK